MRVFVPLFLTTLLFFHAGAQAQSSIREQVNAALDSDIRTADERARDVQRQPADELLLEVGRPEVSGASDRFVFLFMKPES